MLTMPDNPVVPTLCPPHFNNFFSPKKTFTAVYACLRMISIVYASLKMFTQGLRKVYAEIYRWFTQGYASLHKVYAEFMQVYAGLRDVYAEFMQVYTRFMHSLRKVYARFTRGLCRVYAGLRRFTQGLCRVYTWFTQGLLA